MQTPQYFPLHFAHTYTIIYVCQPPSVQGTISSYKNVRKNGTAAVYYNLQYTHKGKNHSFAIPVDKVEDFKAAITAGRKLKDLVLELSLANARELASAETPLKKSSRNSS